MSDNKFFLRNEIGACMASLGKLNNKVVVVNADLMGTCRNKTFVEMFSKRSFNVGIAEQNLVSFAAGLAHEGFIPYVFSMAPFITMRACEQCRTDVAYSGLNVRLIGTYAGCSGGISGATHWAVEDCGIMTSIAGMTVLEPSDPFQAVRLMELSVSYNGPVYLRNSVEPVNEIYSKETDFEIGKSAVVKGGDDGAFLCSGIVVKYALEASERIKEMTGKKIRVIDMYSLKPLDADAVLSAAKTGHIIAAQDHNVIGGLGYAVAAVLACNGVSVKFKILGISDRFVPMAHAPYLYHKFEYDTEGLVKNMLGLF